MIERIESIAPALDNLFPAEGREEIYEENDPRIAELRQTINDTWSFLPEKIRQRIERIERAMQERCLPLVLHETKWHHIAHGH